MKKVLVLVFSNLRHDARVKRQVNWLREKYEVTVVCFDADDMPGVRFVRIKQTKLGIVRKALLALSLTFRAYRTAYHLFHDYAHVARELNAPYDAVIANDIDTLPLAFEIQAGARVVFDAHEYAPRHFENNRTWRIFFQRFYIELCKQYIPRVSAMLTVGEGLAREYDKNFAVAPVIITNASPFHSLVPSRVSADKIRLVHHGIANPSRRLELMVDMMKHLDERFTLDLILMVSDFAAPQTRLYIDEFRRRAEADPRIRFLPPVPSEQVVTHISEHDIGVFLIPPVNFNYANTLPNKLFEYIQARLGVAIGPSPEMAAIVTQYANGIVADTFDPADLAGKLNALTREDIIHFKEQSAIAAGELNAENNGLLFHRVIESVLS